MKKTCIIALFSVLAFAFLGCRNSDDDDSKPVDSTPLSYSYLSSNRSFMGGSLIYDPSDSSGALTQIKNGVKIAVRLGTLVRKYDYVKESPVGTTSLHSTTDDDVLVDQNGAPGATVTSLGEVTAEMTGGNSPIVYYSDVPAQARYGYITVNSVSPESISFTYTRVNKDNSVLSKSVVLKKGEKTDLNGDGVQDIKYDAPLLKRSGYSENARWLTFITDENLNCSSMYATFSESSARAGYRAVTDGPEKIDAGLYGVNSDGDFVWLSYDKTPATQNEMAYGDYVICLSQKSGFDESDFGNTDIFTFTPIADSDLPAEDNPDTENNEFYEGVENATVEEPSLKFGGSSYVVITDESNTPHLRDSEYLDSYDISFTYNPWQFPDAQNGPEVLMEDLCEDADVKLALNFEASYGITEKLSRLNVVLQDEDFLEAVLAAKEIEESKCDEFWNVWKNQNTAAGKQKYARILLDELYDSSPSALIDAPEITNIYPDMVVNLGEADQIDDFLYAGDYNFYTETAQEAARAIHSKYDTYVAKHKKMEEEWKKFFSIDLSQIILWPSVKDKTKKFNPKRAGIYLGLGIKVAFCVTKKRSNVTFDAAIWLDIDINPNSVNAMLDYFLDPATGKQLMEPILKKIFSSDRFEVKMTDVTFNVWGVPLVFGAALKFGINFKLGQLNPHLCFSGMYGTDSGADAEYGVKWFCKPYFDANHRSSPINSTEFYVGVEGGDTNEFAIEPWVRLQPSFGLGCSTVSLRISTPITLGVHSVLTSTKKTNGEYVVTPKGFGLLIGAYFTPYFEANLKVVKIRKDFITLKPIDHNMIIYPLPVRFERRK